MCCYCCYGAAACCVAFVFWWNKKKNVSLLTTTTTENYKWFLSVLLYICFITIVVFSEYIYKRFYLNDTTCELHFTVITNNLCDDYDDALPYVFLNNFFLIYLLSLWNNMSEVIKIYNARDTMMIYLSKLSKQYMLLLLLLLAAAILYIQFFRSSLLCCF